MPFSSFENGIVESFQGHIHKLWTAIRHNFYDWLYNAFVNASAVTDFVGKSSVHVQMITNMYLEWLDMSRVPVDETYLTPLWLCVAYPFLHVAQVST